MEKLRVEIEERIRQMNWTVPVQNIIDLIQPAIRISTYAAANVKTSKSKFGGLPDLTENLEWPRLNEKPLAFLGQINFSDLHHTNMVPNSLKHKLVSFFISGYYEHYRGTNPKIHKTVITQIDSKNVLSPKPFPKDLESNFQFTEKQLTFQETLSLPSYQHWKIEQLEFNDEDEELYSDEIMDTLNECLGLNYHIGHQLFGYSNAIQGDTNSSWATKYLNCDSFPRTDKLIQKEIEFKQLVQFDLMNGFESISDGCAYYGYLELDESKTEIQCDLQNT